MLKPFEVPEGLAGILADKRLNAILIGPGFGVGPMTCRTVEIALASGAATVLDADALTSYEESAADAVQDSSSTFGFLPGTPVPSSQGPSRLFSAISANPKRSVVLTPHDGEFRRLFGTLPGSRLDRARSAAATSGAVIVLKGADTCVASPDGRAAINENAPPWLATAGSGDVLAGFITGLLAQGMPAFEAACAAVWLHGASAQRTGSGLIAEDLPETLPAVLRSLQ
jgi:NAD(P)H-hydrate epimerase